MKNPRMKIYAQNGNHGLDIYLDISGFPHYLVTRRPNTCLYLWLKDGVAIDELYRTKPRSNRLAQKQYHHAKRLIILAEEYLKYELAA